MGTPEAKMPVSTFAMLSPWLGAAPKDRGIGITWQSTQSAAARVVSRLYTCGRRSEMPMFMATTEGARQMLVEGKV